MLMEEEKIKNWKAFFFFFSRRVHKRRRREDEKLFLGHCFGFYPKKGGSITEEPVHMTCHFEWKRKAKKSPEEITR